MELRNARGKVVQTDVGSCRAVVVQAACCPPGQVSLVRVQLLDGGLGFGQPHVQISQVPSVAREMTGLWASAPIARPTRVNGPVAEVEVEWMTVDWVPQTLRLHLSAISALKRW